MSTPEVRTGYSEGPALPVPGLPGFAFIRPVKEPNAILLALQFQFERTERWAPSLLEEHQCAQAALVLRHAFDTVPYYRRSFIAARVPKPAKVDLDFIRSLPVSRREDLQAAGRELVSVRPPADHGAHAFGRTSGSTGRPVNFGRTEVTHLMWRACAMRDYLWHRRPLAGKIAAIRQMKPGEADPPHGLTSPKWGAPMAECFETGPGAVLDVAASPEAQIAWLHETRPDQLVSLTSNLVALAQHARRHGVSLPSVAEVRTFGEMVTAEDRRLLAAAFGGKVTDMYTCEEAGYLALQCPEHGAMHVMSENVLLEILDEENRPCPEGLPGRVVITSLNNFLTPLIRYDIGDYAEFGPPCPCGRGLPVIAHIHGRRRNRVILPGGRTGFPKLGEFTFVASENLGIRQFRCIQKSLEEVELQLVADRRPDEAEQASIAKVLTSHLGHPFRVTFSFPERIAPGANGKHETFVSQIAG